MNKIQRGICLPRAPKIWLIAVFLLMCSQAVASALLPRGYALRCIVDAIGTLLMAACVLAFARNGAASWGRGKVFWALLSSGCGLLLLSQFLWTYFEIVLRTEVPNPFAGDVLFFLAVVPMLAALTLRPHVAFSGHDIRLRTLDFIVLLLWWLYLYLFFVIPWQYVVPNRAAYGPAFNLLSLAEECVLVAAVAVGWWHSAGKWKRFYAHFLGAGALYLISDYLVNVAIDQKSYYTGSWYDLPSSASLAWITVAALSGFGLSPAREFDEQADGKFSLWLARLSTPVLLSLPALTAWDMLDGMSPEPVRMFRLMLTLGAMMLMLGIVVVRQRWLDIELARANHELREASLTDLLTGVRNRRFFMTTIESDVLQANRTYSANADAQGTKNRDLIYYLVDVDHFKEINDRYGHDAGDKLLVEIARRISSAIRNSDVLIRWGGEEFLVVSRYTSRDDAETLAARVLVAVGGEPFDLKGAGRVQRTCSIGWAVYPWFVTEPEAVHHREVLDLADRALYEAKASGRNRAVGVLPATEESIPHALQTEQPGKEAAWNSLPGRAIVTLGRCILPSLQAEQGAPALRAQAAALKS